MKKIELKKDENAVLNKQSTNKECPHPSTFTITLK